VLNIIRFIIHWLKWHRSIQFLIRGHCQLKWSVAISWENTSTLYEVAISYKFV